MLAPTRATTPVGVSCVQAKIQSHRDAERALKERLQAALESGPKLVIDLDWEDKQTPAEMRHLAQQLSFSYAANKQVGEATTGVELLACVEAPAELT